VSAATAVAVPRRQGIEQLQWLAPAPLWDTGPVGAAASGLTQPWIAELRSDAFVSDFLGLLGGRNGASPAHLANIVPHRTVGGVAGAPYRLFQSLSQCYYLVSATLVCRRPGIPDHAVKRAKGQRVSFVMRRIAADGSEQAWVPAGGTGSKTAPEPGSPPTGSWVPALAGALVPGEEKYPMHPTPVAAFAPAGSTAAMLGMAAGTTSTRTVFYGYVPVGQRERMVPALADPVAALAAYVPPVGNTPENPWLYELLGRVIDPWNALTQPGTKPPSAVKYASLYLLLDLADWLTKYLPNVYQAITTGSSVSGAEQDLLHLLQQTKVKDGANDVAITDALVAVKDYAPLVTGADIAVPQNKYQYDLSKPPVNPVTDVSNWFGPAKNGTSLSLADYALAALVQAAGEPGYAPEVPPELRGLIKIDPITPPPGMTDPTYVIRTVFEHEPCQPVLSAASHAFVLARAVDAEAPARKVRIQLPDITHLRQFQRGVAFEMSPSLRRVMHAITPSKVKGILDGSGFAAEDGLQLGMICSFSLQIIFLCAFIILFVFLLLLNIVFWWMAFLKICFPIPVKAASSKAPQP